ncbi:MFS transporter [Serratia marcescens]|nr:MFS transporter [Serratia marcescens]
MFGGVGLAFAVAAAGTLGTLVPLVRLPTLLPQQQEPEHPLRALASGFQFVWRNKVVGSVVLLGMLMSIVGAVRVLFPALAQDAYHVGASSIGLMYSAVPLGAMLGALTSGWVGGAFLSARRADPGRRHRRVYCYRFAGAIQPLGAGAAGAGVLRLCQRHRFAPAIHADPEQHAGSSAGAGEQPRHRAGRNRRFDRRAGARRTGQDLPR